METFWQDVRQGLRMLARNPGFTAVAIATLALGIGANTAIFSVVNAVLLRPLPYAGSDRLVRVSEEGGLMRRGGRGGGPGGLGGGSVITNGTFKDWRESSRTLDGLAAYQPRSYTLTGFGEPVRLRGTAVSTSMFPMLRARPSRDGSSLPTKTGRATIRSPSSASSCGRASSGAAPTSSASPSRSTTASSPSSASCPRPSTFPITRACSGRR